MKQIISILSIVIFTLFIMPEKARAIHAHQIEIKNAPAKYSKKQLKSDLFSLLGTMYFKEHRLQTMVSSLVKKNGKWYCSITNPQRRALKKLKSKIKIQNGKLEFADIVMGGTEV